MALLVGGVVAWLAGQAHLSCIELRRWITIGTDIQLFVNSFIHSWRNSGRLTDCKQP
jgi:hypothetical protein